MPKICCLLCFFEVFLRLFNVFFVFGIGPARRPGRPSPSGVAQGCGLIPVDSVGEAAGVVSEAAREEKLGGNGVEGTSNKDMANDGMIFEAQANRQALEP